MRLLFLNYEFPPVGGGAARASLATARELVSLGHRVDFLTIATNGNSGDDEIDGIRVYRVRAYRRGVHESGLLGALTFVGLAAGRLRTLARLNRYDAYHYYFALPTGLLACFPGPHRSQPYVVSLRGSDVPGYETTLTRHHKLLLPISRRIWRGARRVVANSYDLRRLALRSMPELSIDVILNGAALPTRIAESKAERTGVRIVAVSRLIARKGLDTLIVALSRLRGEDVSLDIAGEGPLNETLQQLARSHGVADRVRFHGFLDRAGLDSLLADADIFVLTSVAESCSMALLEAMAAGLPVIATRVGGTTELIEHGSNGLLIDAQNIEELSAALRTLARDPAQRQRFAAANRALVRDRFSWQTVARQYEAIFLETLGGQPAGERLVKPDQPVLCSDRDEE
ncbi:MAG TPA: glycosyltransferase family 4 protein [Gammaproteobacteria bacterium]|nr:glycosyltransferase family 4 protein [Gammaproteobacteria bacterium]